MFQKKKQLVAGLVLLSLVPIAYGQGAFTGPCVNVRPFNYTTNVVCQKDVKGKKCECWGTEYVYPPIDQCQNTNKSTCTLRHQWDWISYNGKPGTCLLVGGTIKFCLGGCIRDLTTRWNSTPPNWNTCN